MKRTLDVLLSILGMALLSPLLIILAVLVYLNIGSPIFFKQTRPGRYGKSFKMIKFRTMTDARDSSGRFLPDSERLTPFGLFLRSTSLDELPELWNVLKGDMSLVGPRPLLLEYLPLYTSHQARRHEVRPGITGWAQVNGRNTLSWEEKFELDIWYIDNQSFLLDLRIITTTVRTIFSRKGIVSLRGLGNNKFTGGN
jgi:lipopolysaccharide/colanic/teichoic acid biosynthesis glycosyltransferase